MKIQKIIFLAAMLASLFFAMPTTAQSCPTGVAHCVNLSFTAPTGTPAATGYFMYRATGACATGLTFTVLNTTAFTTLTYQDTSNLMPNGSYCYYVTAVDAAGIQSLGSNQVQAAIPGPPGAPTGLSVTSVQ